MNIQCELCKEIVPVGTFASSAEGIRITCRACAGSFFVASGSDRAPVAESFDMRCPKCGDGQPDAQACRSCGLRSSLFDGYAVDEDAEALADLEPHWDQVVISWTDPDAHKRFLDAVSTASQFAWAARKYRARLRQHPGDDVCNTQLLRIARMTEATLAVSNSAHVGGASRPYKSVALLLLVLVLFAGLGGLYFLFKVKAAGDKPKAGPDLHFTNPPVRAPAPTR